MNRRRPLTAVSEVFPKHNTYLQEAIQREIEKEQIRQEIIRRDMTMGDYDHSLSMMRPAGVIGEDMTHRATEGSREAKAVASHGKKKTNLVGQRPEENIFGSKRKAKTRADIPNEVPLGNRILNTKKPKKDWSCATCQLNTTSEITLNNHLQGKKHKAKEAAVLKAAKITITADSCADVQKRSRKRYKHQCDICNMGPYTKKAFLKHKANRHSGQTGESQVEGRGPRGYNRKSNKKLKLSSVV